MAEAEAYEEIVKGSLKLKGIGSLGMKKKKKKNKAKEVMETIEKVEQAGQSFEERKASRTPAEQAFEEIKKKRQKERILKKAEQTHKQRVEELNQKLDTLSEHYDIPKVSWTK